MTRRAFAALFWLGALGCGPSPATPTPPAKRPTNPTLAAVQKGHFIALAAARAHACALTDTGSVWCWGSNGSLQVSPDCGETCSAPQLVKLPTAAVELRLSDEASCARLSGGQVRCWGQHRPEMQLQGPAKTARLVVGDSASCGIDAEQQLQCGGWNLYGRLGFREPGVQDHLRALERVPLPGRVSSALVLLQFGCAATTTQELYCWGTPLNCDGPRPIALGEPVASVEGGGNFACFVGASGKVFGRAEYHERTVDGERPSCQDLPQDFMFPLEQPLLQGTATTVSCYGPTRNRDCETCQGCVVDEAGATRCWSSEEGDTERPVQPRTVHGVPPAERVARGDGFACALSRDRRVYCWGANRFGQLGRGSATAEPERVPAEPQFPVELKVRANSASSP